MVGVAFLPFGCHRDMYFAGIKDVLDRVAPVIRGGNASAVTSRQRVAFAHVLNAVGLPIVLHVVQCKSCQRQR
jgi:hypothetical protein